MGVLTPQNKSTAGIATTFTFQNLNTYKLQNGNTLTDIQLTQVVINVISKH